MAKCVCVPVKGGATKAPKTKLSKPLKAKTKPKPAKASKPKAGGSAKPKPAKVSKPKAGGSAKPKPAKVSKPKPAKVSKPKPGGTSKPKPGGTSKPKPGGSSKPKPAGTFKPKPVIGGSGGPKKPSNRHANMFILFFLETWRKNGGNIYRVAKECGKQWWTLPQSVKDKYKRQYCIKCRACKSCQPKK